MPGIIYKNALRRCRASACRMRRASFAAHISQGSVDPFARTLDDWRYTTIILCVMVSASAQMNSGRTAKIP